jgi:signal transduction histidine kinase
MGANAVILVVSTVIVGSVVARRARVSNEEMALALGLPLAMMFLLNYWLVTTALRPIRGIEQVARRVADGDFSARFGQTLLDDRAARQLGQTINVLLTALAAERTDMHRAAARVIDNADRERSKLARELLESTAQNLAGLTLQLEAITREATPSSSLTRLRVAQDLASETLAELRAVALAIYPTVLDDLGLAAALRHFAARVADDTGARVTVHTADADEDALSQPERGALYRVAEEAVLSAIESDAPVTLTLRRDGKWLILDIVSDRAMGAVPDDGVAGMRTAVLNMRSRLALVGGVLDVDPRQGGKRHLSARVPVHRVRSPQLTLPRYSYDQ